MRGTLLNTGTVAVGAGIGLAVGKFLPPSYERIAIEGLGLVVSLIGVKMFFQSKNAIIPIAAIAMGGILGACIGIAPALAAFAEWARVQLGGGGQFNEALITTSVLYCVGPMTLLGCLQDGIEGKIEILAVKSTLDGISAIFFAATLGAGVMVTAVIVLVLQGALTLAARPLQRIAKDEEFIAEATAVGGALIVGIALRLLSLKRMHMETYLPALLIAPMIVAATRRFKSKRSVTA